MKTVRLPSPARSQGAGPRTPRTPIRHRHRRTLSVSSARSNAGGRLTALIQQNRNMDSLAVSPLESRKSILSDNTDIEEPRRKSWWKKLGDSTKDVAELLEENKNEQPNNIIEELDIEVLSQEKKNYSMDLPESSDSESINSIVIPQRKLFTQKENQPQKKYGELIGTRETLAKLHKTNTTNVDKTIHVGTRELFQNNPRSKPLFPAALLNISLNNTATEKTVVEPEVQVRKIFGNQATKRKNIFTNFIVSESEDEIPEIQHKIFGFQKKIEGKRRGSSSSRGLRGPSPTSSITTDIEMEEWGMLPSSTMIDHQLEVMMADGNSPKRTRLSKLTEIESGGSSNTTKQSNKSAVSKEKSRKSKTFTKEKNLETDSIAEEIFGQDEESASKPRKSKTFIKEKASEAETTKTRNISKNLIDEVEQNQDIPNKASKDSRKSKTFIKDKEPIATRNKSNVSLNNEEESFEQNQDVQKDIDKSRKSKTFTKEKATNLEALMTTRNKSNVQQEEVVQNQVASNKSKSKIADPNTSQSSIKTRSQSMANSPNKSQIICEEITEIAENNKSKNVTVNPTERNIETENNPSEEAGNDDDELNFKLEYEDEEQQIEKIPEAVQYKSNTKTRASKSMTQQEKVEKEKSNKSMPNQVIEKSAELESTTEKSNYSLKVINKTQTKDTSKFEDEMEVNDEQAEHNDASMDNNGQNVSQEMDVNEEEEEQHLSQEVDENDEEEQDISQEVDKNEEDDQGQDISQEVDENEVDDEQQDISQEVDENKEDDEKQDISQEVDENEEDDEEQDISQEVDENEEDNEQQDMSQEVDENKEDDKKQDISQEVDENEEDDEEQDISQEVDTEEGNESEVEDQESEAIADSENDDDEPNNEDAANDNDNQDNEVENDINEIVESEPDETDTPNISHDTTGRYRKKNGSPEVMLHNCNDPLESFAVRGRNTSVRKIELIKTMNDRPPSLASVRESTSFSDGTKNSSAEGSGWDSHRTTRKTLRQTFGRDFTPRKSLRALVMEKSAKRQTQHNDLASVTAKFPLANSTELPEMSNRYDDDHDDENQEPNHEVSLRTRQTTLEMEIQKIRKNNAERRLKLEEAIRNSLNAPPKYNGFKVPAKPLFARRQPKPTTKPKKTKSTLFFGELPPEVIEDFKYKPPKRFQPSNASWITKRLYKFLETKLEPKYDYRARVRAEKLVEHIYHFAKDLRRHDVATSDSIDVLKREMARLNIVKTHFEFYDFFHEFMPREVRVKVIPDIVNKMDLPRRGVFSDIL